MRNADSGSWLIFFRHDGIKPFSLNSPPCNKSSVGLEWHDWINSWFVNWRPRYCCTGTPYISFKGKKTLDMRIAAKAAQNGQMLGLRRPSLNITAAVQSQHVLSQLLRMVSEKRAMNECAYHTKSAGSYSMYRPRVIKSTVYVDLLIGSLGRSDPPPA